jgi:histidyl-tRNA synthetase
MPTFRAARGTRDLLPDETRTWTRIERLAADLARTRYGSYLAALVRAAKE